MSKKTSTRSKENFIFWRQQLVLAVPYILWFWYLVHQINFTRFETPKLREQIFAEAPIVKSKILQLESDLATTENSIRVLDCGTGMYFKYDSLKQRSADLAERVNFLKYDIVFWKNHNKSLGDYGYRIKEVNGKLPFRASGACMAYQIWICCVLGGVFWLLVAALISWMIALSFFDIYNEKELSISNVPFYFRNALISVFG